MSLPERTGQCHHGVSEWSKTHTLQVGKLPFTVCSVKFILSGDVSSKPLHVTSADRLTLWSIHLFV